tara:strand:- start:5250 stop:5768 length:519 start_codon:yes stop_codon:yes gene_type:complete
MAVDRAELQRMAQLVEFNRERMQTLEQQIRQLETIRMEQIQAIEALRAIPEEGAEGAMIPLGSGLQIIADIPSEAGAVIDIGSRVQAERTRGEAADILSKRGEELVTVIDRLRQEFEDLDKATVETAQKFNESVEDLDPEELTTPAPEKGAPEPKKTPRRKRKRGTELTLDD